MINIYLDDIRDCPKGFILAKDIDKAIDLMRNNKVNIISLDHDLGVNSKGELLPTGYDLVKYICEHGIRFNKIYIHTDNPVGRDSMYQTLIASQKRGFIDKNIKIYKHRLFPNKYSL